ncbi:hypothetical protein [Oceanirhabdus seepicola]|uniref:Uncharacterized protein n=1 Tax=Oceanirhabdus seepicola TaxID=2828781 RepID=A0A9J6P7X5_9CLOT|nr:hypothetical protein [Oceanirhabdus seepicola]MCM1992070.1 hypothetical protein [Oceanirhabdus seepicola]
MIDIALRIAYNVYCTKLLEREVEIMLFGKFNDSEINIVLNTKLNKIISYDNSTLMETYY